MRHTGAGLAIPDFPLMFGHLWPTHWDAKIAVHFAHRVGALLVAVSELSTAAVYARFDREAGFEKRCSYLREMLTAGDLAALPPNDLASSPLAAQLADLGAFRADVTGAGPAVYGLFRNPDAAEDAARRLEPLGRTFVTEPAW